MASKIYRDKSIGEYIRSGNVACCITGITYAVVNHHIKNEGYGSVKAPDYMQCALSHDLHILGHAKGWQWFEKEYGRTQRSMTAETMAKLHADGVVNLYELDIPDWMIEEMESING